MAKILSQSFCRPHGTIEVLLYFLSSWNPSNTDSTIINYYNSLLGNFSESSQNVIPRNLNYYPSLFTWYALIFKVLSNRWVRFLVYFQNFLLWIFFSFHSCPRFPRGLQIRKTTSRSVEIVKITEGLGKKVYFWRIFFMYPKQCASNTKQTPTKWGLVLNPMDRRCAQNTFLKRVSLNLIYFQLSL